MPSFIELHDFSDPALDAYARMNENQLLNRAEPEKGLFIAESPKVIERALHAGYEPVSVLLDKKQITEEAQALLSHMEHIPVYLAEYEVLRQLTGFPMTRGALCAMRRPPLPEVTAVCSHAHRIALLENVVNPTNVGAIIRSAAALDIDALLLTPDCCDPLYRRAIRVSMGTVFQIPWTYIGKKSAAWQEEGFPLLKSLGFKTAAMALREDSIPIDHPALRTEEKLAILLGAEGDGLSDTTIEQCDYTVRIPMAHGVDSLNVAAASAVAFWQLGLHPA